MADPEFISVVPTLGDTDLLFGIIFAENCMKMSCHCCYFVDFTVSIVDWRVLRVVERICSQLYVAIGSALLRWVYDDELLSHVSCIASNSVTLHYVGVFVNKRLSLVGCVRLYYITYCVLRVHSHLRFIRRELLHELFSPSNYEKMGTQPINKLFSPREKLTK